jgi:hypothetical protein
MTKRLTPAELQMNAWRRWRKKLREKKMRAERIVNARKEISRRWSKLILWAPSRESKKKRQLLWGEYEHV